MKRLWIATVMLLWIGCHGGTEATPSPAPVLLIFADVTDSLNPDEYKAVHDAIFDIFDRAPENTRIVLYPVVPVMAYATELVDTSIPFRTSDGVEMLTRAAEQRRLEANQGIAKLTAVGAKLQPHVPSSCLSGALRRAANDLSRFGNRPVEIVVISDMVEECDRSITGRKMLLNHPRIDAEIAAASALEGTYADLRKADVYFIYPASTQSGIDINRPRAHPEELQSFWSAVLSRCNTGHAQFLAGSTLYHSEWPSARKLVTTLRAKNP